MTHGTSYEMESRHDSIEPTPPGPIAASIDGQRLAVPVLPPSLTVTVSVEQAPSRPESRCSSTNNSSTSRSSDNSRSTSSSECLKIPDGWEKYILPNGSLYYYTKEHCRVPLVTPDNISDPKVLDKLLDMSNQQLACMDKSNDFERFHLPDDLEFHLRADSRRGTLEMVSRKEGKCYDAYCEDDGRTTFWFSLAEYPMHFDSIPPNIETDFLTALTYGANELALGNKDAIFPFNDEQIQRIMQIYQDLKERQTDNELTITHILVWHIATVMHVIEGIRHEYFYGTSKSRLYRDTAIPEPTPMINLTDFLLTFILFGAHTMYRKRLQSTRVKGTKTQVNLPDFRKCMQSLLVEWADSNLLATVFVSANVAFLAVPAINSLQRVASLASSFFSLLSIVIGVHHVWQHRGRQDAESEDAAKYLTHVRHVGYEFDLTITACLLCLPLVSLLWSVLCFTVAVSAFGVQSADSKGVILLVVVLGIAVSCGLAILMFFWNIWIKPRHLEKEEEYRNHLASRYKETDDSEDGSPLRPQFDLQGMGQKMARWIRHRRRKAKAIRNSVEAA